MMYGDGDFSTVLEPIKTGWKIIKDLRKWCNVRVTKHCVMADSLVFSFFYSPALQFGLFNDFFGEARIQIWVTDMDMRVGPSGHSWSRHIIVES